MKWFKRLFCRHVIYLEDMSRMSDELVVAFCHKCSKPFSGDHGLLFLSQGASFARKPPTVNPEAQQK